MRHKEKNPSFYPLLASVIFSLSFGLPLLLPEDAGASSSCQKALTGETQTSKIEKTTSSLSKPWTSGRVMDFIHAKQFGEKIETDQELHDFLQELREPLFQVLDSHQISYKVLDTEKLILELLPNTTSRLGRLIPQLDDFKKLKIIYDPSNLIKRHAGALFRPSANLGSYSLLSLGHEHLLLDFVDHLIVHELIHAEIHEKEGTHPFLQDHFPFEEPSLDQAYEEYFSTDELLTHSYTTGFLAERLIKISVKMKPFRFQELQGDIESLRTLTLVTSKFNKEILNLFLFIFLGPDISPILIRNDGFLVVIEDPWSGPFEIGIKQKSKNSIRISLETSQGQRIMEFSGAQWMSQFQEFKKVASLSCPSSFCSFRSDSPHWPFFSKVIEEAQMRIMKMEEVSEKIISILDQIAERERTIKFMDDPKEIGPILVREYLELHVPLKELAAQQGLPKVEKFVEESFSGEKN